VLRFANPLPEYFNNLRRRVHRGLCLHATPASTRCSPRSCGELRSGPAAPLRYAEKGAP
jgi:hypothetical protein